MLQLSLYHSLHPHTVQLYLNSADPGTFTGDVERYSVMGSTSETEVGEGVKGSATTLCHKQSTCCTKSDDVSMKAVI